jgi:hypothetical protein
MRLIVVDAADAKIYGFMRKVSLRHVDRGICDPDASTWCEYC